MGTIQKEFVLAGQGVDSASYCDVSWWLHENVERLHHKLWRQKELAVVSWQCTIRHFLFTKSNMTVIPHPPYLPNLAPCNIFLFEGTAVLTQVRWLGQYCAQCWIASQILTSRMHLQMAEALATVHMCRRDLLLGWWWPAGPKLVFDQMATPALQIMDGCGILDTVHMYQGNSVSLTFQSVLTAFPIIYCGCGFHFNYTLKCFITGKARDR
jgi:hypothetical protein